MSSLQIPGSSANHASQASFTSISQGIITESKSTPLTQDNRAYINSSRVLIAAEEQEKTRVYGVLVANIKSCHNLQYSDRFPSHDVNIYVRISTRGLYKRTKVTPANWGNPVWNDIKHFPVTLLSNPKHPFNLIRFEIVAFCSQNISDHKVIGSIAFHSHDVVKASPSIDTFDLFDQHEAVGTIDLELAFSYGMFGYGYSDQLKEEGRPPEELVAHSLFPRIMPPTERRDGTSNLLLPMTVPHPRFIPFSSQVKIGYGKDFASMIQKLQDKEVYPEDLMRSMTRFKTLKDQLNGISDKMQRLNFLRNQILEVQKSSETTPVNPKLSSMTSEVHGTKSYARFVRPAKLSGEEFEKDRSSSLGDIGMVSFDDKPQPISERSSEKSSSQVNLRDPDPKIVIGREDMQTPVSEREGEVSRASVADAETCTDEVRSYMETDEQDGGRKEKEDVEVSGESGKPVQKDDSASDRNQSPSGVHVIEDGCDKRPSSSVTQVLCDTTSEHVASETEEIALDSSSGNNEAVELAESRPRTAEKGSGNE